MFYNSVQTCLTSETVPILIAPTTSTGRRTYYTLNTAGGEPTMLRWSPYHRILHTPSPYTAIMCMMVMPRVLFCTLCTLLSHPCKSTGWFSSLASYLKWVENKSNACPIKLQRVTSLLFSTPFKFSVKPLRTTPFFVKNKASEIPFEIQNMLGN